MPNVKELLITVAIVLVVIFALNKIKMNNVSLMDKIK